MSIFHTYDAAVAIKTLPYNAVSAKPIVIALSAVAKEQLIFSHLTSMHSLPL